MCKYSIMSIKIKICKIFQRWHTMVSINKSSKCIFLQRKYDKHRRELPSHMPSSGILGMKISQTKIISGRVKSQNENSK